MDWAHLGPSVAAAFLGSLVEFVEALTIVLAVGTVRGWRSSLTGSGVALALLLALVAALGPVLTRIPLDAVQLLVGGLLLLFGLRWLRKAILRAAGVIPLHDESDAFTEETESLRRLGVAGRGWDHIGFMTSFKITMLEGIEVVFIVVAIGAGNPDVLTAATLGAGAALLLVVALGLALHRPLSSVPENTLKFAVGILLSAFGTFWVGEGAGIAWPGEDWAILMLAAGYLAVSSACIPICRSRAGKPLPI